MRRSESEKAWVKNKIAQAGIEGPTMRAKRVLTDIHKTGGYHGDGPAVRACMKCGYVKVYRTREGAGLLGLTPKGGQMLRGFKEFGV